MKSKVLIIIPHLSIGGTEVQTINLVKALRESGREVDVLCLFRNLPAVRQKISDMGASPIIISPQYDNYDINIEYPKGWLMIRFLYRILREQLKKNAYDVIHLQYMTPAASIALLLKYVFRQKNIIATSHTHADIYPSLHLTHFIVKNITRNFQCITERAETSFFGFSRLFDGTLSKHFTIYNCLPEYIKISSNRRPLLTCEKTITVGVVSRLEKIKGMDFVVEAFRHVKGNVRLLIVGDGQLKNEMQYQSQRIDNVRFVGRQSQTNLQDFYDEIDILLMPSRSEGFGLTAIEGMARGCVPLVANTGGLPEVVEDGKNGLLHVPCDICDMARKIQFLVDNPETLHLLSCNAIDRAKDFSFETYSSKISDWYSLIENS